MKTKIYGILYVMVALFLLIGFNSHSNQDPVVVVASEPDALPATPSIPEIKSGWVYENGGEYFYRSGYVLRDAWIDNAYVDDDGRRVYNQFIETGGNRFYINIQGVCAYDRFYVDDKEYFANKDGVILLSTWIEYGDDWIYVSEDGSILKETQTPDGYTVDADGLLIDSDEYASYAGFTYSLKSLRLNIGAGKIIWDYCKKKGWTDTAIAGMLGNFQQESHLSPGWSEKGGDGYGLGQWSFGRRDGLEAYARSLGKPVNNIYVQMDYLMIEPSESLFVKKYMKTNYQSAGDACIAWCTGWERPNMKKARLGDVRIPYAMGYYAHFVQGVDFLTEAFPYQDPVYADEDDKDTDESKAAKDETQEYTELIDEEGNPVLGWIFDSGGWWYRLPGGTYAKNEWKKVDGEWYWFGEDGYMQSGTWITDDKGYNYRLDEEGHVIPIDENGNEISENSSQQSTEATPADATETSEASSESSTETTEESKQE